MLRTPGYAQQNAVECPERLIDPSLSELPRVSHMSHKLRWKQYLQYNSLCRNQGSQLSKWSIPATVSSNSSISKRSNAVNMASKVDDGA